MKYPTLDEVNQADIKQLLRWKMILHGPGYFALGMPGFSKILADEMAVFIRINARYKELWEVLESTLIGGGV